MPSVKPDIGYSSGSQLPRQQDALHKERCRQNIGKTFHLGLLGSFKDLGHSYP